MTVATFAVSRGVTSNTHHQRCCSFLLFATDFVLGRMDPDYQTMVVRLMGTSRHDTMHLSSANQKDSEMTPHVVLAQPIWSTLNGTEFEKNVVGYLFGIVAMDAYLSKLLPARVKGITAVVRNTCGEEHSFWLEEDKVSNMTG